MFSWDVPNIQKVCLRYAWGKAGICLQYSWIYLNIFKSKTWVFSVKLHFCLGEQSKKQMSQKVEKPKRGEAKPKIKKSTIPIVDYFEKKGGPDFQIFPKFKCMKYGFDFYNILVTYWWDIGKFGTNMADIWLKLFQCSTLIWCLYGLR